MVEGENQPQDRQWLSCISHPLSLQLSAVAEHDFLKSEIMNYIFSHLYNSRSTQGMFLNSNGGLLVKEPSSHLVVAQFSLKAFFSPSLFTSFHSY